MKEMYPVIADAEQFYYKGSDIGILLSHGFCGTPQSVQHIGKALHNLGYTVYAPRVKGHGTHYHDLEFSTNKEWFQSIEQGHKRLEKHCSKIFVIGQSMGGTLALHLANTYNDNQGLVLINPALTIPSLEHLRGKTTPRYIDEGEPDIKAEDVYEITYEKTPLAAIHQLQNLMEHTPAVLPNIHNPILVMKSAVDNVVPPENSDFIMEQIGSSHKSKLTLHNSFHVASMDNDKDLIVEACHQFVQKHVKELICK